MWEWKQPYLPLMRRKTRPAPSWETPTCVTMFKEAIRLIDPRTVWLSTATCVITTPARTPPPDFEDLTFHRHLCLPACLRCLVDVSCPFRPCMSRLSAYVFSPGISPSPHVMCEGPHRPSRQPIAKVFVSVIVHFAFLSPFFTRNIS